MMTYRDELLTNYPNHDNNQFPLFTGCVHEIQEDNAKNGFLSTCFKDVTIDDVIPLKRNCQPSCAWRVYYKLRDRTPDFVETGKVARIPSIHCQTMMKN